VNLSPESSKSFECGGRRSEERVGEVKYRIAGSQYPRGNERTGQAPLPKQEISIKIGMEVSV
jgi:hypothetical protein